MTNEEKAKEIANRISSEDDVFKELLYNASLAAALKMCEWKEQQMIEKTAKWIEDSYPKYIWSSVTSSEIAEDFKQIMRN